MPRFSGRLLLFAALLLGTAFFYFYPKGAAPLRSIPDFFLFRNAAPEPSNDAARLAEDENLLRVLREENAALKRSLGVVGTRIEPRLSARVLWKDPDPGRQALRISIPQGAAVHVGDAVVAPGDILIGVVDYVFLRTADVLLTTDSSFKVGARLDDNTGLVMGEGRQLEIKYLPAQIDVVEGAAVYTSGLEGKIPTGLLLGWAEKVSSASTEPFTSASVLPAAQFNRLGTIFILPYIEQQ